MAALKYFLILGIVLYCTQFISGSSVQTGYLLGADSVDLNIPDMDYNVQEEVAFDEAELEKTAKLGLSKFMSNVITQGIVTDARKTIQLLLTEKVSSEAIIKLMHLVLEVMTDDRTPKIVRLVQNFVRQILKDPELVKQWFDDFNDWFKDPRTLENVKRKDDFVDISIRLAAETKILDHVIESIQNLGFTDAPEVVDTLFRKFDFLVNINPNFRIQDAAAYAVNKTSQGITSLVGKNKTDASTSPK